MAKVAVFCLSIPPSEKEFHMGTVTVCDVTKETHPSMQKLRFEMPSDPPGHSAIEIDVVPRIAAEVAQLLINALSHEMRQALLRKIQGWEVPAANAVVADVSGVGISLG
jgi:hypothetical protein